MWDERHGADLTLQFSPLFTMSGKKRTINLKEHDHQPDE